jgi:hypothetical protein
MVKNNLMFMGQGDIGDKDYKAKMFHSEMG